ncbi:MAG: hypothetical protein HUJ94_00115 [Bacteroidales bacterium]|nr:hypothetical protein [Bacteroidales bacterium]
MKKIFAIISAFAALVACEEWEPVFTGEYEPSERYEAQQLTPTHTIQQLCKMYSTSEPWTIDQNIIIAGQVSTDDQTGNFYKSFYIQDETAGIEIKIGRNSLHNEYQPGQWIYVKCLGLTLGMYGYKSGNYGGQGMVQLGYVDPSGSYETSYLESPLLVDAHIIKGAAAPVPEPEVLDEKDLPTSKQCQSQNRNVGRLVTLKGLKYANEAFVLLYLDSQKDTKLSSNRIFVSDAAWGITTWAMSKDRMKEYLHSGIWDEINVGNANDYNYGKVGDHRVVATDGSVSYPDIQKSAYSVSQYFKMGQTEIQLRTSGYSKFSDLEMPADVLAGRAVDMTGILTMYQGSIQFVVNSQADFVYSDTGEPLYK